MSLDNYDENQLDLTGGAEQFENENTEQQMPQQPKIWDYAYWTLFQPVKAMRVIAEHKPVLWGLLVYLFVDVFQIALSWRVLTNQLSVNFDLPFAVGRFMGAPMMVLGLLMSFLVLFVSTAIINLIAELFGGKGDGISLLAAFAFARLPGIFGGMVNILSQFINLDFLKGIVLLVVFIWVLVLQVLAVKESQNLSTLKSLVVRLLPGAVVFGLVLVFIVVVASSMGSLMNIVW